MKIGIVPTTTKTGEGRYAEYLIDGLQQEGFNIEILNDPILLNRPNIKIFLGSLRFKKFLKNKNPSIIHNLDNLGPFLVKQNLKNVKTIQTVFDIAPVILPNFHNIVYRFNFKCILPILIGNSDSVIVPSNSTKKDLISNFRVDKNKINVIPLGVDKSIFYPRSTSFEVLKKYGINYDYLIYVGGDNPRKNLKNLISAFIEIFQDIPHQLVLIGPLNKDNLIKIIKGYPHPNSINQILDRIVIPGYVDNEDLPVLYSAASALVFPSIYEGFGLPPLEAMACGTPVITSSNSSLKEVVGNAGLLIKDPLNPNEISEKILNFIDNGKLQENLKMKGLIQTERFTWDKTVKRTVDLYGKLI